MVSVICRRARTLLAWHEEYRYAHEVSTRPEKSCGFVKVKDLAHQKSYDSAHHQRGCMIHHSRADVIAMAAKTIKANRIRRRS